MSRPFVPATTEDSPGRFHSGRHAGLLLPLSAAPSRQSWGIGEVLDLPLVCRWLRAAGLGFLQILPPHELPAGQHSPYSAMTAMAIDPIFVSLRGVSDFLALGGETALSRADRRRLAATRRAARIDYDTVRRLKMAALRAAFRRFHEADWISGTARARQLQTYMQRERYWIADYALYRALSDQHPGKAWWDWPPALARRDKRALARARKELDTDCLFYSYVQWLADSQWRAARWAAAPVGVFGDLAFMVQRDSADVWAHQHAFRLDATVGAPPDALCETGQDWSLPVYRWDVFAAEDDAWIRARARRSAELFDGYRVDHLVGFYRMYVIPADGSAPFFHPAEEADQQRQGERIMNVFLESGARIIAEDLGTVPDFVRASLLRLGIPGYKVLRWERDWSAPGQPFRDPAGYPRTSVATTGTHDTETLVEWWEGTTPEERALVATIPELVSRGLAPADAPCDARTRDALLEMLAASSSDLLILPVQDVFGWRDRINVPSTVGPGNWTWRLPWPADQLCSQAESRARATTLLQWMRQYGRVADTAAPPVRRARPPRVAQASDRT
jgi:4-alpha-glucanotransferase